MFVSALLLTYALMDYHLNLVPNVVLIETMCSDCDPNPYIKGEGHKRHLKVRVHMLLSALLLTYALMDSHLTWYKCCPH